MRFAHLSDSHLGYRQFGKYQREQDFYDTFLKTIDKIIELDVDFVIHSGDIFDSKNPSPNALIAFQKGLLKLNEAGIPIFAIAGNHDTALRKNVQSPIEIFEEVGLNIIKSTRPFVVEGVLICGLQYIPSSQSKGLEAIIENLSAMAEDYSKSILVLHQGVDIYFPGEAHELSFQDLPQNFDYYAMGHLHDYVEVDCGRGKFVYPGSTELYQLTDNFRAYGKGFCLVDMSHNTPKVERINIEPARQRFDREIQYKNIYNELKEFRDEIKDLNQKPIVDIRVVGGEFETSEVYEILTEILGDYVLVLRPFYRPDSADDTQIIGEDEFLNPIAALRKRVDNKYENDDVTNLSVDLLDMLSINSTGDAQYISDSFYDQHYYKKEGDEE